MPALIEAGVSNQQLLAVWSTNADTGFTIDQLLAARITLSQMYDGDIPGHILFNEACNTPLSVGTAPNPTIKLLSTNLSPTNTHVMLETKTGSSAEFSLSLSNGYGFNNTVGFIRFIDSPGDTIMSENVEFLYLRNDGLFLVCIASVPLSQVFSNFRLFVIDAFDSATSIQLCPGR